MAKRRKATQKKTEVIVEDAPVEVKPVVLGNLCKACGADVPKKLSISTGQGEYLCKPCYSKGK